MYNILEGIYIYIYIYISTNSYIKYYRNYNDINEADKIIINKKNGGIQSDINKKISPRYGIILTRIKRLNDISYFTDEELKKIELWHRLRRAIMEMTQSQRQYTLRMLAKIRKAKQRSGISLLNRRTG